jgi:uncharacterized protein (TIGR03435 family)
MRQEAIRLLIICAGFLASGQTPNTPLRFEAADVHVSPKSTTLWSRSSTTRGRYQNKNATIVDLIRAAYDFDSDKVLGGPNWLESDRFDVIAKLPEDTTSESRKQMLQTLLGERFKLIVHKETRPMPVWALRAGKKVHMTQAASGGEDGKEQETGCKPQPQASVEGRPPGRIMMMNASGTMTTFELGPGGTLRYACRNLTMAGFTDALRSMFGTNLNQRPILNETGLEGRWNFELTYTGAMMMMGGDSSGRISILQAVDKQLGLKLEEDQSPTPVIVVDSVNRKPAENPSGTAEALPPITVPTEFEVASIKEVEAGGGPGPMMRRFGMQPGGRFQAEGSPLSFLVNRAFNTNNRDQVVGLPQWADSTMFNITAKASIEVPSSNPMVDTETLAPMLLSLLKERFHLAYHAEERPCNTYTLTSTGKPKMKKADPASRIFCKTPPPPPGSPPMSRVLTCQNVSMAQLGERLQGMAQELSWPVADATELDGAWDFTLTFNFMSMPAPMIRGPVGDAGHDTAPAIPTAADPTDTGMTIFQAVEKQLGLKLTLQKRPMQVIVIDHIDRTPTEN